MFRIPNRGLLWAHVQMELLYRIFKLYMTQNLTKAFYNNIKDHLKWRSTKFVDICNFRWVIGRYSTLAIALSVQIIIMSFYRRSWLRLLARTVLESLWHTNIYGEKTNSYRKRPEALTKKEFFIIYAIQWSVNILVIIWRCALLSSNVDILKVPVELRWNNLSKSCGAA